jgi:hypothetical protein
MRRRELPIETETRTAHSLQQMLDNISFIVEQDCYDE